MTHINHSKLNSIFTPVSKIRRFCFTLFISFVFASTASAQEVFTVDPASSKIDLSVRYITIGKYKASFKNFSGTIRFDPELHGKNEVDIEIDIDSIQSEYPTLDKMAKSRRLLYVERYPKATFRSRSIEKTKYGYRAEGMLNFHGVSKEISFLFTVDEPYTDYGKVSLIARGQLVINRKNFNIIWSSILDHGGIIVSNNIVLNWEIFAAAR